MLHLIELLILVGAVVVVTFLILLALPASRLRDLVMPFVAWGFVALCAVYAISPVDILPEVVMGPFGLLDDFGAVVAGIGTAVTTIRANRQKQSHRHDPYFNN